MRKITGRKSGAALPNSRPKSKRPDQSGIQGTTTRAIRHDPSGHHDNHSDTSERRLDHASTQDHGVTSNPSRAVKHRVKHRVKHHTENLNITQTHHPETKSPTKSTGYNHPEKASAERAGAREREISHKKDYQDKETL